MGRTAIATPQKEPGTLGEAGSGGPGPWELAVSRLGPPGSQPWNRADSKQSLPESREDSLLRMDAVGWGTVTPTSVALSELFFSPLSVLATQKVTTLGT